MSKKTKCAYLKLQAGCIAANCVAALLTSSFI